MRHLPALRVLLIYPAPSTPCSLFDALQSNSSFQLEKVDHPSSGFEKALRDLPDVVLLACKPFNQETLQFCQKLRAQVSLPLILISNSPLSDQEHTIGLEAGALICLTFATPPSVLVATLHSLRSHLTAHKRNHERVHKENEALPLQFYHQKSFLETVMRLMPAGLSIASSPAGQLLFINEEAKRLLVGDPSSATPFDLESVRKRALHRDGTPYLPNEYPLARAINQGESIFGEEISFIHQDGKETCVAVYASPVHNDEGKIIAAVSIFFDIARQKKLEMELQQAVQLRDEFLSIATHELNTPLASLLLNLQLFQRRIEKSEDSSISKEISQKYLVPAISQVKKLSKMLTDLLDLSRIRNKRLTLEIDIFDLSELAQEVASRLQEQARCKNSEIRIHTSPHLIGYWDKMRIEQVITNLISNAIKYGDGKPIDLKMEREDSMAKLSVQDRGIGITPKDQSQIFERFVRATDQEKKKSLGLGLFIVKQIVEAHNGKISVSSAPGQGSTFSVTLPLTRLTSTQP